MQTVKSRRRKATTHRLPRGGKSRWERYEAAKAELAERGLSVAEFAQACRRIAALLRI